MKTAFPPAALISPTTRSPAAASVSLTTTAQPSPANSLAASAPSPAPEPVITATLPSRRDIRSTSAASRPLEIPLQIQIRHPPVVHCLLLPGSVHVVIHHDVAEGSARSLRARKQLDRLVQRHRHLAHGGIGVGVPGIESLELEIVLDAVQTGRDRGGKRQVRIGVGARRAVLPP